VPRIFNKQVDSFISKPTVLLEKEITDQLTLWRENDAGFKAILRNSPVLQEAALLSENLSLLSNAGLQALQYIKDGRRAGAAWLQQQTGIVAKARQQGGRCELQVVDAIEKLIKQAAE